MYGLVIRVYQKTRFQLLEIYNAMEHISRAQLLHEAVEKFSELNKEDKKLFVWHTYKQINEPSKVTCLYVWSKTHELAKKIKYEDNITCIRIYHAALIHYIDSKYQQSIVISKGYGALKTDKYAKEMQEAREIYLELNKDKV